RGLEVVQGRALLWRLLDLRRLAVSELLEMLVVPGCQRVERLENAIDEVPGGRRQSPLIAEPAVRVARMELWIPGRQVDGELDPVEVEFATLQHRRHASLLRNHAILRVELPSGDRVNLALLAPRLSITDFLESVSLLLGRESVAAVADRGQAHVELAVGLGDLDLFVRLVHREAGHGETWPSFSRIVKPGLLTASAAISSRLPSTTRQSPDSGDRRSSAMAASVMPGVSAPATQIPCLSSPTLTTAAQRAELS